MLKFPDNFLWGAATSAYQVEGNNTNSDWWEWEKLNRRVSSGSACQHYELYKEDFDLAKALNHNAHRLSLEWSRIEPEQGKFSEQELKHYRDVILALKERGLEPIVTLHHFSNPIWFTRLGGWENKLSAEYFLRFVERAVNELGNQVHYWIPVNEPMVYVYHSYIAGFWPPQEKSFSKAKAVENNLASACLKAYKLIHVIYKNRKLVSPSVGIAQNMQAFVACQATLKNKLAVRLRDRLFNFAFINRLTKKRALDFIGVNYYSRSLIEVNHWGFKHLLLDTCKNNHLPVPKNSLGWDIYSAGLYELLLKLKKYKLPVMISENGICTEDDNLRWDYIAGHLKNIHSAIEKGVEVSGYLYWSLLDNYEWDKGFTPRFGIIEVDYSTFKRTIRESANKLATVCRNNAIN
jgi:beta-glucosidase